MLTENTRGPFEARKLEPDFAEMMGVRYRQGRFEFDYRNEDGSLAYQKWRTPDKSRWGTAPDKVITSLWRLEQVPLFESPTDATLIITEGEFDALAAMQAIEGRHDFYVVSLPTGAISKKVEKFIDTADDGGFHFLWKNGRLHPKVEQFNRIILATDNDDKGTLCRDDLSIRIGPMRCWYLPYPDGAKDINDVLIRWGEKGVRRLVDIAKPMRSGQLQSIMDVPPPPSSIAYSTGFAGNLDKHIMIVRPELMVITGAPGAGKGVFARCLAAHLAEQHGWKTAFIAREDPAHRIRRDLIRFAQRKTPYANQEQQAEAREFVRRHFFISTIPEDENVTMPMVFDEMEAAVYHHDCEVFIIDPWNEISYDPLPGESETKNVERLLVALKQKMRRLNLLLIIAAHPRKPSPGEKLSPYSISGSANWFNKMDHGVQLERESPSSKEVEFTIGKCKDHETMGVPGSLWMEFDRMKFDYMPTIPPEPKPKKKAGQPPALDQTQAAPEPPIMDTRYGATI